jgi:hypothetical protein
MKSARAIAKGAAQNEKPGMAAAKAGRTATDVIRIMYIMELARVARCAATFAHPSSNFLTRVI